MALDLSASGSLGRTRTVAIAAAGLLMAATAVWLALTSDHLPHPLATGLYGGYLVAAPMLIGLYWWLRRPRSRFGPLLMGFGTLAWVYSWESSDVPLLFDLGVLVEGPLALLTFYMFLAFPSGRLQSAVDRLLIAALAIALIVFFGLWALLSPVIAGGGPLSGCIAACPDNVLQIGSAPDLVVAAGNMETYLALAVTVGVALVYARRLGAATPPQRRALTAVAASSLVFLPVFFVYHFSRAVLNVDPARLETLSWALVTCRILLPLGFLAALLQAELFAGKALRRLIERLATRPTPEQWRASVAAALDDPPLTIGYWDIASGRHRQEGGALLEQPAEGSGRRWVRADRDGQPVAAMVVDEALTEDPELLHAAASATVLAVENGALEGEREELRARVAEAGAAERRRIQRDLHDSAQQRLVALRINLSLAGEQLADSDGGALVSRLGLEVDEALSDVRSIAHGVPRVLAEHGVAAALRSQSRWTAIPVRILDGGVRRHADAVEATVYYCCLEALQNTAKHGGPAVSATITLTDGDALCFTVEDDGAGFDPDAVVRGAGLSNLADRLRAVGGTLEIDSSSGRGTRVAGRIPA
jgi:signal transduction histidine kinase